MPSETDKTDAILPTELEDAAKGAPQQEAADELFPRSETGAAPPPAPKNGENQEASPSGAADQAGENGLPPELIFNFDDEEEPPAEELPEEPSEPDLASELRQAVPYSAEILSLLDLLLKRSGVDGRRFLEIGSGDAVLSKLMLDAFPGSTGVLLDIDEPSLSTAWRRLGEDSNRMAFVAQDISHPEWAEAVKNVAPFDVVLTSFVIDRQADEHKVNIYSDIFEMLSPGGLFFNLDFVSISAPFARKVFDSLYVESLAQLRAAKTGVTDLAAAEKDYLERPDRGLILPSQTDVQCDWLREIGFVGVDCFFRSLGVAFFGGAKPRKVPGSRSE